MHFCTSFGADRVIRCGDGTPKQSDVNTRDTYIIGDANGDSVVSISDATTVQKALAEFDLDFFDETAGEVNGGGLTITDATKSAQKQTGQGHEPVFRT